MDSLSCRTWLLTQFWREQRKSTRPPSLSWQFLSLNLLSNSTSSRKSWQECFLCSCYWCTSPLSTQPCIRWSRKERTELGKAWRLWVWLTLPTGWVGSHSTQFKTWSSPPSLGLLYQSTVLNTQLRVKSGSLCGYTGKLSSDRFSAYKLSSRPPNSPDWSQLWSTSLVPCSISSYRAQRLLRVRKWDGLSSPKWPPPRWWLSWHLSKVPVSVSVPRQLETL